MNLTIVWAIAGVVAMVAVLTVLVLWHRTNQRSDLGTLSERWMAEQRFRSFDSNRWNR